MSASSTAKRVEFWLVLALGVAGAGFAANAYLSQFASAAVVDDHEKRLTGAEVTLRHVEEDFHWQREQTSRIADRVGAERVPPPKHE